MFLFFKFHFLVIYFIVVYKTMGLECTDIEEKKLALHQREFGMYYSRGPFEHLTRIMNLKFGF